tara:strand:+ start:2549 stop:2764 length:216 start_codon:yes stop_codon:yes gene_type:complete
MITKDDISPGSLVRLKAQRAAYQQKRAQKVGVLVAFDHFGRVNPDKGDPLVLWVGEKKPARMAGSALEIVS